MIPNRARLAAGVASVCLWVALLVWFLLTRVAHLAMSWMVLVIAALGVYRITRLLTVDDLPLVAVPRAWLGRKLPGEWALLVFCPWCLGAYVSVATVALLDRYGSVPVPLLTAAAFSAVAGFLSQYDDG